MSVNDDTPGAKNKNSANTHWHKTTKSLKAIFPEMVTVALSVFYIGLKQSNGSKNQRYTLK